MEVINQQADRQADRSVGCSVGWQCYPPTLKYVYIHINRSVGRQIG